MPGNPTYVCRCGKKSYGRQCRDCYVKGKGKRAVYKTNKRYPDLKDKGLCVRCGIKERYNGTLSCEACSVKRNKYFIEHRERKKHEILIVI